MAVKKDDKKNGKKIAENEQENTKKKKAKKEISTFREYAEMIIEVLVIVFFINTFLLQSQTIPTPSMVDTMLIGDHLLVDKVAFSSHLGEWDKFIFPRIDIQRGMIITFKGPTEMEKDYVKRVIAVPGDTIRVVNKQVYLNGKKHDEPYVYYEGGYKRDPGDNFPMKRPRIINALGKTTHLPFTINNPAGFIDSQRTTEFVDKFNHCVITDEVSGELVFKVPEGHYFCMGDNRDNSYDSRFWGPVPEEYIIGKPWRIYWSFESETKEYLTPGILHKIKDIFKTAVNFFTKTRWKRTFKKFE